MKTWIPGFAAIAALSMVFACSASVESGDPEATTTEDALTVSCTHGKTKLPNGTACGSHAVCETGVCVCATGFFEHRGVCMTVNACATNNGGCSSNATCTSTGPGTNTCTCKAGFTGNGVTCTAVSACAVNNGGCSPDATCTSTGPGTDSCACNAGFAGNGLTCTPL